MARPIESELAFASAVALVEQIRTRKIGCIELFDFYRERVERLDPRINAIVVRRFETARKIAANCDAALARGDAVGPLHGLPMTIKESFDLPELPTTWGFREYADKRAIRPAVAADRFEKAGAVIFGKTNVPVALADWQSFNPIYGTTNNPWDVGRTPGGSSGGSAAALAAGLTALELGSDIGGSIRNPAHYCGVYGHKPTFDIVPREGQALPGSYALSDISVAGPLARSAFDLELALDTIAGANDFDGRGWKLALPKPRHAKLSDYRVAVMTTTPEADVDETVRAPIEALARWLERQGVRVAHSVCPVDPAVVNDLFVLLRFATTGRMTPEYREELLQKRDELGTRTDFYATMVRALTMSHFEWLQHNNRRHELLQEWRRFFERFDVFLCPTAATTAFPHDHVGDRWERSLSVNGVAQPHTNQLFWAGYSGLFFLPSTVAPIARAADGLPVGVQIVGAEYDDRTCLHFAQALEREYYAFEAPPDFA